MHPPEVAEESTELPAARKPETAVRSVPISEIDLRLEELRLASPTACARLQASLRKDGLREPLLVSDLVESGRLVLVDGFKRLSALKALNLDSVSVCVVHLPGDQAEAAILTSNAAKPGLSDVEEAWVVRSLHRVHGLKQVEIANLVHRHKSWVCRRLWLLERLDAKLLADVRLGLVSTTAARELSRLPRGNQVETARVCREHGLASRQIRRLVDLLAGCDVDARRAVLSDPLQHLAAAGTGDSAELDARLTVLGNRLRKVLLRLHSTSNRLAELLLDHGPGSFTATDLEVLGEFAPEILSRAEGAQEDMRKLIGSQG